MTNKTSANKMKPPTPKTTAMTISSGWPDASRKRRRRRQSAISLFNLINLKLMSPILVTVTILALASTLASSQLVAGSEEQPTHLKFQEEEREEEWARDRYNNLNQNSRPNSEEQLDLFATGESEQEQQVGGFSFLSSFFFSLTLSVFCLFFASNNEQKREQAKRKTKS